MEDIIFYLVDNLAKRMTLTTKLTFFLPWQTPPKMPSNLSLHFYKFQACPIIYVVNILVTLLLKEYIAIKITLNFF